MISKTPQFDKALDEILKDLKPHARKCGQCSKDFEIFKEDIGFYHILRVPPPKLCPNCRKQRRLAFSNNTVFYRRKCDAPGHSEDMISLFPKESEWKVFDNEYWWSDAWDSMDSGFSYDSLKAFFPQFQNLYKSVPLVQTNRDPKSVGSEYSAYGIELKDCYYVFGGMKGEDIMYGNWPVYARNCMDILIAYKSELCYENVSGIGNYNSDYIYFSENCLDSKFLYDCKNCTNCFGCTNLRNKQYYFFNQPLTKEEYSEKLEKINLGSREVYIKWRDKFLYLLSGEIRRATRNHKAINSVGTFLRECKDCFMCFWVEGGENLRYVDYALIIKDSMDVTLAGGAQTQKLYEVNNASSYDVKFSLLTRQGVSLEYCISSHFCENCFGCVGLKNKKYCIFNKQYSEEEYWQLLDKIKTKMLQDGEYGEFFPVSMDPYPYNSSLAQFEHPLTKEVVEKIGGYWAESAISLDGIDPKNILKASEVSDDIKNVGDDILNKVIICEVTGKPFRIIPKELEFYRRKNLPLPIKHPYQRILERWAMKEPFRLWKYPCSNCRKEMYTSYAPEKKLKVYCEECYLKEVV